MLEKGLEQLKKDLQSLDQEVATVYAEQQDGAKWSGAVAAAEVQEVQDRVDDLMHFQTRLKDAFIDLTARNRSTSGRSKNSARRTRASSRTAWQRFRAL